MKNSISKPVLAMVAAGLALIVAFLWFGPYTRTKKDEPAPSPIVAGQSTANPASPSAPAPVSSAAEPVDGLPAVIPISLTNVITAAENNVAQFDPPMRSLPHGTQVYGGIEFWLQGMIDLQGSAARDQQSLNFRIRVNVPLDETNLVNGETTITRQGSNIACAYVLGATRFSSPQSGEKVADVLWHYVDGSTSRHEIKYNVEVRDWWRTPYEDPAQLPNAFTKVAWIGPNPESKGRTLRLYRVALVNPHPEKVIASLEFASAMARPSLFVMALTLDPLLPGMRPDNLTSAEGTDPELGGQIQLFVQDTEGHPLGDAQVTAVAKTASAGSIGPKYRTDNNGLALVRYPDSGLESLEVSASHDDYGSRKMVWDIKAGDTVPATYTLKLDAGVNIGGTVVDESNSPIAEAKISLNRFWSGGDEMNKKGEQADYASKTIATDTQGQWQATGLPVELLDHIMFDVKHPDFIGTNVTVGANATTEKQLREGKHKIVLHRGLEVRGRVVDESDQPVAGATVWAGRKYYRDRQQTQSDDQGRFAFHSVNNGDTLFSVMAKGHGPDSRNVHVQADMSEIIFKLKPGSVLHAHVQDDSSLPVSNARVGLEGNPGETAYDAYEFSANTDSEGNFSWDSAPDEPTPFYIFHDGFEAKRGVKLAPNQDNTVTLRRSRQVQGQVLDADTEQPVTKFSVRTGHRQAANSENLYGVIKNQSFSAPDGRFTMTLDEENDDAIAVYSDDYSLQVQSFPEAQNGIVSLTVRLKPSAALRGVVTAPDGTPLPGVSVAIAPDGPSGGIQLQGTHLSSWNPGSKVSITDSQGQFTLGSPPETGGMVVAVGELGFASASVEQVRANPTVVLLLYGRIEGTLKSGGQPAAGRDLLYTLGISGVNADFNSYKSTTDDQGRFAMEKIPPGEGAIVHLIPTSPNSWSWSDSTAVTVQPGQTTHVTLGDTGAVLKGTVRFETPPADGDHPSIQGTLSAQMPNMPSFNSSAEAQAFFSSPEWKALSKLRKTYAFVINPDGSFAVDDVVPGTYSLNISARKSGDQIWSHPPIAQGQTTVTVPDSANPFSPIYIGETVLKSTAPMPSTPTQ